jgi:hypothetical protein
MLSENYQLVFCFFVLLDFLQFQADWTLQFELFKNITEKLTVYHSETRIKEQENK